MAWTTPRTWSASVVTVSDLNTHIRDNENILKTSIADDGRVSGELKTFREEVTTVSISAGVVTLNLALSNAFKVSLTANVTSIVVSNLTSAKSTPFTLRLSQDGTGGRTVAFPAGWLWSYGTAPTMTATANKTDIVSLYSDDGTNVWASMFVVSA